MANLDIRGVYGMTDKRKGSVGAIAVETKGATVTNMKDITSMRGRLNAISGTTYTVARLNAMTHNDMRYAILLNDDPTSGING